jgi:hypothetical protein
VVWLPAVSTLLAGEAKSTTTVGPSFGANYSLPGYYLLQLEHVRKELALTADQEGKLQDVAKRYAERLREGPKVDWAKLKPEEQKKIFEQARDRYAKLAEEVRKQVEQVLQPQQLERLKEMEFRQQAASMLYSSHVLDQIGLNAEQKGQIVKIREEAQRQMQQIQNESQQKTLAVLNAEQMKKLRELTNKTLSGAKGQGK